MISFIVFALFAAAAFAIYKFITKTKGEVETAIETEVSTAETVAEGVVDEIKAKI